MIPAAVLLAEIRAAGVDVGLADGMLRVRAPKGVLTATQRQHLVEHHAEIIRLLANPANDLPNRDMSRTVPVCPAVPPVPVDSLPASLKVAFEERAAIAEVDGGLDRAAAERLAWEEVNAGPIGDTLEAWRAWMNCRIPVRMARCLIAPQQSSLFLQSRYTPWRLWRDLAER
jgi:hypothetical protein